MDPFQIIAQLTPRAQSEDELVRMAAELAPPPSPGFRPAGPALPQTGVAGFSPPPMQQQGVGAQLAGGAPAGLVPPMTQGEARTAPNIGQLLTGG